MKTQIRREQFLAELFTNAWGDEAFTLALIRRDGANLGGYCREVVAKMLEKHFPGAGRKTQKPRAGQRRRKTERTK